MLRQLAKLLRTPKRRRRTGIATFETLEARALLAVLSWTGDADNQEWRDPRNWSPEAVPRDSDSLVFAKDASVAVSFGDIHTFSNLTVSANVSLIGGATFSGEVTVQEGASLSTSGGSLSGGQGAISGSTSGSFSFESLVLTGSANGSISASDTANISGTVNGSLSVRGNANISGSVSTTGGSVSFSGPKTELTGAIEVTDGRLNLKSTGHGSAALSGFGGTITTTNTRVQIESDFGQAPFDFSGTIELRNNSHASIQAMTGEFSKVYYTIPLNSDGLNLIADNSRIDAFGQIYIGGKNENGEQNDVEITLRNNSEMLPILDDELVTVNTQHAIVIRDGASLNVESGSQVRSAGNISVSGGSTVSVLSGGELVTNTLFVSDDMKNPEGATRLILTDDVLGPGRAIAGRYRDFDDSDAAFGDVTVYYRESAIGDFYLAGGILSGGLSLFGWQDVPGKEGTPGGATALLHGVIEGDLYNAGIASIRLSPDLVPDGKQPNELTATEKVLTIRGNLQQRPGGVLEYDSEFSSAELPTDWAPVQVGGTVILDGSLDLKQNMMLSAEQMDAEEGGGVEDVPFVTLIQSTSPVVGEFTGYNLDSDLHSNYFAAPIVAGATVTVNPKTPIKDVLLYTREFETVADMGLGPRSELFEFRWNPLTVANDQLVQTDWHVPRNDESNREGVLEFDPEVDPTRFSIQFLKPGYFHLLALHETDGIYYATEFGALEVRFPTMDQIVGKPHGFLPQNPEWLTAPGTPGGLPDRSREIVLKMKEARQKSLNASPMAQEHGFWIVANSATGRFEMATSDIVDGQAHSWASALAAGGVGLGLSALLPIVNELDQPINRDTIHAAMDARQTYLVGMFHTHPSYDGLTYKALMATLVRPSDVPSFAKALRKDTFEPDSTKWQIGRLGWPVGPSEADTDTANDLLVPSLVWDYRPTFKFQTTTKFLDLFVGSPTHAALQSENGKLIVPPEHPLNSRSMAWLDGRLRRPTSLRPQDTANAMVLDWRSPATNDVTEFPPSATGQTARIGNVDGDGDFDANDSFMIHLVSLSGTNEQIDKSKGSSQMPADQIRDEIDALEIVGDVDGDDDFDANDSFLIHLTKLSGTDEQINQSRGASTLTAAEIRSNIDALGDSEAQGTRQQARRSPVAAAVGSAPPDNDSSDTLSVTAAAPMLLNPKNEKHDLFHLPALETQHVACEPSESDRVFSSPLFAEDFRSWIDTL